jgi:predicted transcriptional regulator
MPRHTSDPGRRAARLAAIKADIAKRMRQQNLSVIPVATRQGVTPRYVQMLLRFDGHYVLEVLARTATCPSA